MCAEFSEPISWSKRMTLSERLNFGTLIAALFDFFFSMIITQSTEQIRESPVRHENETKVETIALDHKNFRKVNRISPRDLIAFIDAIKLTREFKNPMKLLQLISEQEVSLISKLHLLFLNESLAVAKKNVLDALSVVEHESLKATF